jgi:ABC-type antimicrobial peptide transport system permease subunit
MYREIQKSMACCQKILSLKNESESEIIKFRQSLYLELVPVGKMEQHLADRIIASYWSLCGEVFSRGFTLLLSIIISRFLSKAGFGLWGLVMTTVLVGSGRRAVKPVLCPFCVVR